MTAKHFEIRDIDGSNPRQVTLAEFRADLDARAAMGKRIMDAVRVGDMATCAKAQQEMRARFPK